MAMLVLIVSVLVATSDWFPRAIAKSVVSYQKELKRLDGEE